MFKVNLLNYLIYSIIFRIKSIGTLPVCNLNAKRAPHINKFCFPLCYRCSSIILSATLLRISVSLENIRSINPIIGIILSVPCLLDGINQYLLFNESTNLRRIVTGFPAGIGILVLTAHIKFQFKLL